MKARRVLCIAVLAAMLACAAVSQAADVNIRVAGFGGTDTAIVEELISRFVKPNLKGIKVTYEPIPDAYDKWIINALSAGTGPDLFYVDIFWSQGLFSSGAVEPLDAYLTKSKVLQGKDIIPALLNGFTYKGKVYGIPKDFNTLAIIYNKDMFDIAKVPYPDKKAMIPGQVTFPADTSFGPAPSPSLTRPQNPVLNLALQSVRMLNQNQRVGYYNQ
jgi:multiple sugar transport system substrate-binding protein